MKTTIQLFLAFLCLSAAGPRVQAVNPSPDGGYPGGNTAEGEAALLGLAGGTYNTAVGFFSLRSDGSASFNTGIGAGTLFANLGDENTATGAGALFSNTSGAQNTANGAFALFNHTEGVDNTANGAFALFNDTSGSNNTANGAFALYNNIIGGSNSAFGYSALSSQQISACNTAVGANALTSNQNGSFNSAVGYLALAYNVTGSSNTAVGDVTLLNSTGDNNTALGAGAGGSVKTASNVICIGSGGADVSNTTWIGNVYGVTTQNGTTSPVIVSADGQLGTVASSERFKKDITTMDTASEAILSLRPVTFHYKTDTEGTPQFGLIAEEVAKVSPALVLPDNERKPYTVRYDAVNAMLLNEFLKEHKTVQEQGATIARLEKQIEALTAGLQKVNAQIELNKPAPQNVLNNQ